MRQHGPEAAQRFRGNARPQLRNVAFQIGSDEVQTPAETVGAGVGQQAVGKAAPYPKRIAPARARFQKIERRQFQIGDTARQGFSRLPQPIHRGGPQQQEAPGPAPLSPPKIDQPAQSLENARKAMNLVEDDQLVRLGAEIQLRLGEPGLVRRRFEIQIE